MLRSVYDYIDVTLFGKCMFHFLLRCLFKKFLQLKFNRRNTVYFKVLTRCVCCLWNSLEQFRGSDCAAGGFVVFACVSASCGCK